MNDNDTPDPTDSDTEGNIAKAGRPFKKSLSDAGTEEGDDTEGHEINFHGLTDPATDDDAEGHAGKFRIVTDAGPRRATTPKAPRQAGRPFRKGLSDAGTEEGDDTEGHRLKRG